LKHPLNKTRSEPCKGRNAGEDQTHLKSVGTNNNNNNNKNLLGGAQKDVELLPRILQTFSEAETAEIITLQKVYVQQKVSQKFDVN